MGSFLANLKDITDLVKAAGAGKLTLTALLAILLFVFATSDVVTGLAEWQRFLVIAIIIMGVMAIMLMLVASHGKDGKEFVEFLSERYPSIVAEWLQYKRSKDKFDDIKEDVPEPVVEQTGETPGGGEEGATMEQPTKAISPGSTTRTKWQGSSEAQSIGALLEYRASQPKRVAAAWRSLEEGSIGPTEEVFAAALDASNASKEDKIKAALNWGGVKYLYDPEAALKLYQQVLRLDERNFEAIKRIGDIYFSLGNLKQAEAQYRQLGELSAGVGDASEYAVTAMLNLADIKVVRGEYDVAESFYSKAENISELIGDQGLLANVQRKLGNFLRKRQRLEDAESYYKRSLAIERELGRSINIAKLYSNLGVIEKQKKNYKAAEELYRKALEISEADGRLAGKAIVLGNWGNLLSSQGRYEEAKPMFEEAIKLNRHLKRIAGLASQYANLGNVYEAEGHYDKALELHKRALLFDESGENLEGIGIQNENIGLLLKKMGREAEAKTYFGRAEEIYTKGDLQHRLTAMNDRLGKN